MSQHNQIASHDNGKNKQMRLVHLEMSHSEKKSEPLYNVFRAIKEIVMDMIFSSYFDRTLVMERSIYV